jgi:hypothetical protein
MIRVYVAGKYSANNVVDVLKNIGHGRKVCAELFALGYSPFCPWHDADFIIQNPQGSFNVQLFYEYSISWLAVSDVMLVISGKDDSAGVQNEIQFCKDHGIPVVYSIEELVAGKWLLQKPALYNKTSNEYEQLKELTLTIWKIFYRDEVPEFKPLNDILGLISQIDNMVSGLTRLPELPCEGLK